MSIRSAMTLLVPLLALTLTLGPGSAGARLSFCPDSNQPNELVLSAGDGQTAQLGKPFETNLQVELANTNGCPLSGSYAGVAIDFVAPGQGASGTFASSGSSSASVGTNAAGVATAPTFTANDTPGGYLVSVRSPVGTVVFYLVNTATGVPASIVAVGPTSQQAATNARFAQPLQVRVVDAAGDAVLGATVIFSIGVGPTGASATFLGGQASAATDSNGLATSPPLAANGVPGRYTATASTAGVGAVATFDLDNHVTATRLTPSESFHRTGTVATRYRYRLQVRIADAAGKPVEGAAVTFELTAAESGAGASFLAGGTEATVLSDVGGRARSPAIVANKTAGAFTLTASTSGATPLAIRLTNHAAAPHAVTAGAASGASTAVGTRFSVPLAVTVTDKYGNPVKGAAVVFTAPMNGATGRFVIRSPRSHTSRTAHVTTNADGVAVAPPFRAGRQAGGFAVTAVVVSTWTSTAFALVDLPR